MCQLNQLSVEESDLLANAQKTLFYLFDAISEQEFESAQLELSELNFVIRRLVEIQKKRGKKEVLRGIVADMQRKGINIDFAHRASFLPSVAKNAVEINQNHSYIHKKRQQA